MKAERTTGQRFFWLFCYGMFFSLTLICVMPFLSLAESLPYEVYHFTNSSWYLPIGDSLYFNGQVGYIGDQNTKVGIWKSDGTKKRTQQISANINSYDVIRIHNEKMGDLVFFVADQNYNGDNELYAANEADGTNTLLEEFKEPLFTWNISPLKVYKNNLFFDAHTYSKGTELWRTDGTPHNATLVKDICPGSCDAEISEVVEFGGNLFFGAEDNSLGRELWVSNGTNAGTLLLRNIYSVPQAPGDYTTSSSPQDFVILGNKLLFTANDGVHGRELWSSDPVIIDNGGVSNSNVVLVKDCTPGNDAGDPYDSSPYNLVPYKNKLYFTINREDLYNSTGVLHWELWETDGTEAGTVQLGQTYRVDHDGVLYKMIAMNDNLFFSLNSPSYGYELFYIDLLSSDKSIHLLKDIYPGNNKNGNPAGSSPSGLTVVSGSSIGKKDLFYFTADSPGYGQELWVSDGTTEGTHLLKDLTPGADGSTIDEMHAINSKLFFRFNYWYLWAIDRNYDGTPDGNFPWNMFLPAITRGN